MTYANKLCHQDRHCLRNRGHRRPRQGNVGGACRGIAVRVRFLGNGFAGSTLPVRASGCVGFGSGHDHHCRPQCGSIAGHVRNWIETWLPQKKNGPTALVVLLDEEGESLCKPPPCCVYLHQVAERGNMDFFCNASHWTLRDFPSANQIIPRHQIRAFDPELHLEPAWLGCRIND